MKFFFSRICILLLLVGCTAEPEAVDSSDLDITTLQQLMQDGELTSVELTRFYLQRIESIDRGEHGLNAIIETNPEALEIAAALVRSVVDPTDMVALLTVLR